jgi:hypothetical protein
MEYSGTMNLKPQIEEGITMIKWLSPEELSWIKANAWLSLIDLINTSILKNLPLP